MQKEAFKMRSAKLVDLDFSKDMDLTVTPGSFPALVQALVNHPLHMGVWTLEEPSGLIKLLNP